MVAQRCPRRRLSATCRLVWKADRDSLSLIGTHRLPMLLLAVVCAGRDPPATPPPSATAETAPVYRSGGAPDARVMEVRTGSEGTVGVVGTCCWRWWGLGRGPLLFPVGSMAWMPMDRFFHHNHCCRGSPPQCSSPMEIWHHSSDCRITHWDPASR